MASFTYTKLDASGTPATFEARVPVLSLVPIPGIRIKTGKIAFTARITDVSGPAERTTDGPRGFLKTSRTRLRGGLSPKVRRAPSETGSGVTRGSFEIDIEVEIESLPITVGIEKLLTTMDQAISDTQRSEGEG